MRERQKNRIPDRLSLVIMGVNLGCVQCIFNSCIRRVTNIGNCHDLQSSPGDTTCRLNHCVSDLAMYCCPYSNSLI